MTRTRKQLLGIGVAIALIITSIMAVAFTPDEASTVQNDTPGGYYIAEWTLSKRCVDGTEIYQLADGDYAVWVGEGEEKDYHWVKLSPGVEPDRYCD